MSYQEGDMDGAIIESLEMQLLNVKSQLALARESLQWAHGLITGCEWGNTLSAEEDKELMKLEETLAKLSETTK